MTHQKRKYKATRTPSGPETATTASLAWVLRDPQSEEELRRTIAAWSQYIARHLHDKDAFLRESAHLCIVRRAAAYAHLKDYQAALVDVERALSEAKVSQRVSIACKTLEVKATIQTHQDDDAGALETFAELFPLHQDAALADAEQAECWLERGKCYGRLGRYEEAVSDFTQAILLDAACGDAWCWRALSFGYLHQHEQAVADATQAVRLQPKNATFSRIRGIVLRMSNRFAESLRELDQAQRLAPGDPWVEQNRRETVLKWLLCGDLDALEERVAALDTLQVGAEMHQDPPTSMPASTELTTFVLPTASLDAVPDAEGVPLPVRERSELAPLARSPRPKGKRARVAPSDQGLFF